MASAAEGTAAHKAEITAALPVIPNATFNLAKAGGGHLINGVRQAFLAAQPAYLLLNVKDRLGVSWTDRPHGMVQGDWDALFVFADKFPLGKTVTRRFDEFPPLPPAP